MTITVVTILAQITIHKTFHVYFCVMRQKKETSTVFYRNCR